MDDHYKYLTMSVCIFSCLILTEELKHSTSNVLWLFGACLMGFGVFSILKKIKYLWD